MKIDKNYESFKMIITNLILFLLSCVVLVLSGSWLVKSLSKIAIFLRLSEYVVSFIIMAFSTSIPELFVGITAALAKSPALVLGTVIGSNIADLTIVIGVAIVLGRGIKIEREGIKKDVFYMFIIITLPIILFLIGNSLSGFDGTILLIIFVLYMRKLIKERKEFKGGLKEPFKRWDIVLNVVIFILSLVLLFYSANATVIYATKLALELYLPLILIGLFFIALGTSLPELIFNVRAVAQKHPGMALGDTIGSVVMNSTLVLGVSAIIYPISANFLLFFTGAVFMVIVAFIFLTFMEKGHKLTWKEGVSLILLYSFFIMIEFYIKSLGG